GGVHPLVLHAGGGAGAVRAAVAGRRLRDGHQLPAVQHLRRRPVRVAAAAPPPWRTAPRRRRSSAGCATGTPAPCGGPSPSAGWCCCSTWASAWAWPCPPRPHLLLRAAASCEPHAAGHEASSRLSLLPSRATAAAMLRFSSAGEAARPDRPGRPAA